MVFIEVEFFKYNFFKLNTYHFMFNLTILILKLYDQ